MKMAVSIMPRFVQQDKAQEKNIQQCEKDARKHPKCRNDVRQTKAMQQDAAEKVVDEDH